MYKNIQNWMQAMYFLAIGAGFFFIMNEKNVTLFKILFFLLNFIILFHDFYTYHKTAKRDDSFDGHIIQLFILIMLVLMFYYLGDLRKWCITGAAYSFLCGIWFMYNIKTEPDYGKAKQKILTAENKEMLVVFHFFLGLMFIFLWDVTKHINSDSRNWIILFSIFLLCLLSWNIKPVTES